MAKGQHPFRKVGRCCIDINPIILQRPTVSLLWGQVSALEQIDPYRLIARQQG